MRTVFDLKPLKAKELWKRALGSSSGRYTKTSDSSASSHRLTSKILIALATFYLVGALFFTQLLAGFYAGCHIDNNLSLVG